MGNCELPKVAAQYIRWLVEDALPLWALKGVAPGLGVVFKFLCHPLNWTSQEMTNAKLRPTVQPRRSH